MKNFITAILLLIAFQSVKAQSVKKGEKFPLAEDVSSISGIIKASYEVISGDAGVPRQWERELSLHDPKAIFSFSRTVNGKTVRAVISEKEYQEMFDNGVKGAFYEEEINREVRIFGTIAHVWSTYGMRLKKDGPVVVKGINSIQLYYNDNRWWILSWNWDEEREDNKIPKSFDQH